MGRGKNKRQTVKGAETEDDDGDDTVSTISTAESSDGQQSLSHEAVAQVRGEKPDIEDVLDMLYEKRSSTREQGLDILSKALTSKLQLDFVMSKGETILRQCLSIFRKGSASEIPLAARTLGLLGISAGESKLANMIFKESFIHLSRISKQSLDEASRISALKSIAILTFTAGNEEDTTNALTLIWQIGSHNMDENSDEETASGISEPTNEVRASALTCCAFLLTTLSKEWFDDNLLEEYFEAWPQLLTMEDRSVRLAVGEGIAIIFENLSSDCRDLDYNESILTTVSGNMVSQSTCDDVVDQMRDLSIEAGGKGTSKKELNSQRNFFNDILDFIEDGSGPNISLKLSNSDSLTVTTWAQSIQVNMFRSFLGGGFQTHMLNNPFLHDVFDFRPKASKKQMLSTKEKRMLYSPNSVSNKARTQELNRRRSNAQVENYGHYNVYMDE